MYKTIHLPQRVVVVGCCKKNLVSKINFDVLKVILNFLVLADVKVAPGKFLNFHLYCKHFFFFIYSVSEK